MESLRGPRLRHRFCAVAAVIAAAATLLAGCGAEERSEGSSPELSEKLEQIEREATTPVYWLGPSFEGLPLTHSEGPRELGPPESARRREARGGPAAPPAVTRGPFLVYGECNSGGDGPCTEPQVQLEHWPIASPARYPEFFSCTRTTIRGVPAAQFSFLEVYVGSVIVKITASTNAQARRVAAALRPLDGSSGPEEPLPPPTIDVDKALERCALDSVDAKLKELREKVQMPLLWAGRRFEDLPLFRAEGGGRLVRFMYGGCKTPEVAGSCYPALTVEVTPAADRHPADWQYVRPARTGCDHMQIRGAEAAFMPPAGELYVFSGPTTVVLRGPDPELVRRAADALHRFDGGAKAEPLAPPADELKAELRRICGA
jgi:hypothetical protein